MIAFALSALILFIPLSEGSAVLVGHTLLKSEDGKHDVQLATFGFPMRERDTKLLFEVMNSDPYWHHFRPRTVYLTVGDKVFTSGPRLWARHPRPGLPERKFPPKFGWTTAFVLPSDVKLTGELKFSNSDGNSKPADEAFAKLELTAKDLKAAAVPFVATIKEIGKYEDALDDKQERHYVVFVPNHYVQFEDLRIGDAKPRRFPYDIQFGEGKGYRSTRPDELIASFVEAPPVDGAVKLKFAHMKGWYKAETAIEKPKDKK